MLEDEILRDPGSSEWLRNALRAALACDPVDVANDAQHLARVLLDRVARADEGVAQGIGEVRAGRTLTPSTG